MRTSSFIDDGRLTVVLAEIHERRAGVEIGAGLIVTVEFIDVLDELAVQKMQRDMLRTDAGAFTAVGAPGDDVEGTDDMEHVLLERIGNGLVLKAGIVVVEHALFARAGHTLRHALQRMQRDSSPRQNA